MQRTPFLNVCLTVLRQSDPLFSRLVLYALIILAFFLKNDKQLQERPAAPTLPQNAMVFKEERFRKEMQDTAIYGIGVKRNRCYAKMKFREAAAQGSKEAAKALNSFLFRW